MVEQGGMRSSDLRVTQRVTEMGFYVALHFSYSCRIVPCPLEVTIKSHFALVLVWIPSEKADTQKLECFLSQSKITLGGFLKNENLYKLFTSRLG